MSRSMNRCTYRKILCMAAMVAWLSIGCAKPPAGPEWQATRVVPSDAQQVGVTRALLIFDASGSLGGRSEFKQARDLARNFVAGMPDGAYDAGLIIFGGTQRRVVPMAPFDRAALATALSEAKHIGESSPLADVLAEARDMLAAGEGPAAVVFFSDGLPTDYGNPVPTDATVSAAQELAAAEGGEVTFHTFQIGKDDSGEELLGSLAGVTEGGSFESSGRLAGGADLYRAQRNIFLSAPLPGVAAVGPGGRGDDLDGDGVPNAADRCPGTPGMAAVDDVGCWAIDGFAFARGSAELDPRQTPELESISQVLHWNPELRVRVDGHADSSGREQNNPRLSELRANAVKSYLEAAGIEAERIEVRWFGASEPIADNGTDEGMQSNRRAAVSVLE